MRRFLAAVVPVLAPVLIAAATPMFTDITRSAGVTFVHNNGGSGRKYYPETVGSGVLFFDADGDERQDLLLVNGTRFPGEPGTRGLSALYRNNGNGTFTDVTRGSGLDVELYGMGGAAADYDNDGLTDVFVSALSGGRLFRNVGNGKFLDVTTQARAGDGGWSSSAMWFDYDRDGFLDLFAARYLDWSLQNNRECSITGTDKSFCPPTSYRGIGAMLLRNQRNGTFANVTEAAGLMQGNSRDLGVAALDFDADGWLDVVVASDTTPNHLYRNNRDGTFTDAAGPAGIAVTTDGQARAGMGVDAADIDGSGRASIVVGNFSEEMLGLYRNEGKGLFVDEAPGSSVGRDSRLSLTFGVFFFDVDLDGRLDIFAANGHISDILPLGTRAGITYAQRPHLFRNLGSRRFEETIARAGAELARPVVARGAAYADIDQDGDLDLVVTHSRGAARLFRNDLSAGARALRVRLVGTTVNRDAIGARIDIARTDGVSAWAMVKTGSSYLSQSELPVTFGFGPSAGVRALTVTWPNGKVESVQAPAVDQQITIREGSGVVTRKPLVARR